MVGEDHGASARGDASSESASASSAVGPVLTVAEVADALRVSTMTVYRLVNAGELPALRVGKNIRIRTRDLDAFLADGVVSLRDSSNG